MPLVFECAAGRSGMPDPGPVLVELALSDDAAVRKVVPYDAVLYDVQGGTWVYTSPEPLVFVRHPVVVEYIDKGQAVLSEGPPAGHRDSHGRGRRALRHRVQDREVTSQGFPPCFAGSSAEACASAS